MDRLASSLAFPFNSSFGRFSAALDEARGVPVKGESFVVETELAATDKSRVLSTRHQAPLQEIWIDPVLGSFFFCRQDDRERVLL